MENKIFGHPPAADKYAFVDAAIRERKKGHLLRSLRPLVPVSATDVDAAGHALVNFCSNDYLGLAKHPRVIAAAKDYADRFGAGATASRLVCGSFACTHALEEKLAGLLNVERVLVLNSGFQANTTVIPALADKNTLIVSDRLNHNSIIQGTRLARCTVKVAPHNDVAAMRRILEDARGRHSRVLIITESVFSMDGDRADIDALAELADDFSALLIVDEAHATGVLGAGGMGLCPGKPVDMVIGTLSKALGAFGAFVACTEKMAQYLINYCTGFIYSTALPPAVIGAVDAALDLVPQMHRERAELWEKVSFLRRQIKLAGFDTGLSSTQILPVIVGGEAQTMDLAAYLEKNGILASGIRFPTVPAAMARIRLALSAAHSWEQIRHLASVILAWKASAAAA
ncbi:putative 8-amino-7-oxononanoate synthase [Desulfosarcina cetonica]|uniref:aminotransferase class I/II-fold pyridoxal phosphate-dependent enzyme n=1 Tax=Desulfosarcina cetonica TaxID=90730 RepID=UPI0006CF843B|nr:8-amino-7-oxononanoate synthase [Desulfosarcina cetonica]VTR69276.1 putative 8-amino-7-oxononanoate synthase [Desulfosarcina cetonica]